MATVNSPLLQNDLQQRSLGDTTHTSPELDRSKQPRANISKILAIFLAFLMMGANDAAYGFESYYSISHTVASFLFLSPVCGYVLAAVLNDTIHTKLGRRGVAWISASNHFIGHLFVSLHPPYPALVALFVLQGFGNGLADSGYNAWVASMTNANQILGIMHGLYGFGAVLSPLAATLLVTKANLPWFYFYYLMTACAIIELAFCLGVFRDSTAAAFRAANHTEEHQDGNMSRAIAQPPYARITWICSFFFLGYMGVEVALGGWIVTYMREVRGGEPFASGMTATGFWLGISCGRMVLGFVTPLLTEEFAVIVYSLLSILCGFILWLVPVFSVSAVAVTVLGFFLGPFFPAAIVVATRILPRALHVSAVGFASAIGGAGAAILPFAVGAIAQRSGVQVLPPIIIVLIIGILSLWLFLLQSAKNIAH
ncbi:uncharacterized protein N7518_002589 [Penicillium psychrosexuale]|uniref:uncharacterized protein n=1 Tax=Penicillium psychrosexuale TaxID=1002107 RepID=UPI0025453C9C|nr:uncharacterized protein N7518_002589 [Penicillium psychrosexuale]KAJ5800521.1 hypothetical protein N7518_002589 [Penicillium psychrosexuale]